MGLPLELILRRYERRGPGPTVIVPWLGLGRAESALHHFVAQAIAFAEESIGAERRTLGSDPLADLLPPDWPDPRLSRAIWAVLLEYYAFEPTTMARHLGPAAAARLAAAGATNPSSLRLLLFERVNASGPGYVPSPDRTAFFECWASDLGLPPEAARLLGEVPWLDNEGRHRLVRRSEARPTLEAIVHLFRRRSLEGLLLRATEATLRFPDGAGWRAAYRLARARYLYAEPELQQRLRFFGPPRAFADRTVGPRLADLLIRLVANHGGRGEARLELREDRPYRLLLTDALAAALASRQQDDADASFDSQIEERFYRAFLGLGQARRGWEIRREPEPLVVGRQVIIPDFLLARGPAQVYLEILGFWSEDYRRRKLGKLRALAELQPPPRMLLAVDQSAIWDELPFPVIRFRETLQPADVLNALAGFNTPGSHLSQAEQARRLKALPHELEQSGWMAWPQAAEYLGLADPVEARTLIGQPGSCLPDSILVTGAGLFSAELVAMARDLLEAMLEVGASRPVDEIGSLVAAATGFAGPVPGLIEALPGFQLEYQSLLEAIVRRIGP